MRKVEACWVKLRMLLVGKKGTGGITSKSPFTFSTDGLVRPMLTAK